MGYGAKQQNMDFKWQIARKVDRLDLGSFAALEFYYRNVILFGIVRAMDPEDAGKPEGEEKELVSIESLMTSIDTRIKELSNFDTTALLLGKTNLPEVQKFQSKTLMIWYELAEVIYRCKLTDNVRVAGEEL